jgi:hypothetical protein
MATFENYFIGTFLSSTLSVNPSGVDRCIVVCVQSSAAPSSVTVGGNAMEPFANSIDVAGIVTRFYYRVAPSTGAQNVSVTGGTTYFTQAWTYSGVDQTTPLRSTSLVGYDDTTGTSKTQDITTVSGDLATDFVFWQDTAAATPGAGQTEIAENFLEGYGFATSRETATGTTTTMSWTLDTSRTGGQVVWAMRDTPAGNETLTIDAQPTTGTTGDPLGTFTIESSDTGSTATVTATKASGPGALSGTTSAAMTAGVVSFTTLEFDAAGTYTLAFNATGHDEVVSSNVVVSDPPSGTVFRSFYDNL